MINTKIYKTVYALSEKLMLAAEQDNRKQFEMLYADLEAICVTHENTPKDHPEQWETLADFTEDLSDAVEAYKKALVKATAVNSKDHLSSIGFSMASIQLELGHKEAAIENLQAAKIHAKKIEDKDLQSEIDELLSTLVTR